MALSCLRCTMASPNAPAGSPARWPCRPCPMAQELDDAELLWYLQHLPPMDMGQIIMQATNIKDDCVAQSIL